jgi:hypothetical protein
MASALYTDVKKNIHSVFTRCVGGRGVGAGSSGPHFWQLL